MSDTKTGFFGQAPWRCGVLGASIFLLASCGGDSSLPSSTETAARGSGTVGVLLTDAPADPGIFAAINVTIEAIHLLGGEEKIEIFSGPAETFNLLDLTHEAVPFGYHNGVPAGEYCKIRLTLADLELVLADDTPDDDSDNETFHPHLPGNGKLDLKARDCFDVMPDGVLTLQVDMDAGKSIHVNKNRRGYNFRPVVFVDVVDEMFIPRLVRLEGYITEVDAVERSLLLCGAVPTHWTDSQGCARVEFGDDAAFFDNLTQGGAPRPLGELIDQDQVGMELMVVGLPRYGALPQPHAVRIAKDDLPDDGECRIWEIGVDAGDQAEPINCADVPEPLAENTLLVTAEGVQLDPYLPLLLVEALAAELGEFDQADGRLLVDADADGFTLDLDDAGVVGAGDPLAVMLQSNGVDFNGTRIATREGELLDFTALTAPHSLQVDGVLEMPGGLNQVLKAALVIVNTDDNGSAALLGGSLLAVAEGSFNIDPDSDAVCGVVTDDLSVELGAELEIFSLTIAAAGSEVSPGGVLAVDQVVSLAGVCEADVFIAENLLIIDDQTI